MSLAAWFFLIVATLPCLIIIAVLGILIGEDERETIYGEPWDDEHD